MEAVIAQVRGISNPVTHDHSLSVAGAKQSVVYRVCPQHRVLQVVPIQTSDSRQARRSPDKGWDVLLREEVWRGFLACHHAGVGHKW